jgi:hypothetical protein
MTEKWGNNLGVEREKKLKAAINTQMQYLVVPIGDARQPFF